jgi:alkylation response protein AidB-like acyl-CoA dehydrogenase
VPKDTPGLKVGAPFDGLGLRGNCSSPMNASGVELPMSNMLGADGGGFDAMLGVVLPWFQVMNAGFSVGTANSATAKAAAPTADTLYDFIGRIACGLPLF